MPQHETGRREGPADECAGQLDTIDEAGIADIADGDPAKAVAERNKGIVRTGIIGIVANVLLAAFKAAIGILSNSIAITLDAVNNLSDATSSVITIVGTKLASKAPDRKHPFGYGRVEYLTTIIVSVIVLWAGITSLSESVQQIITPQTPNYAVPSLIIVAAAVVVKIALGIFTRNAGKRFKSGALVASGTDALTDSIISAATLVAALVFINTGISLEAWLGVIIALVIIKAGIDMLREVLSKILGERVESDVSRGIKQTVTSVPGVHGAYDLFLEDYGPDTLWGSVHVEVDDVLTAVQIDRLTRAIQMAVYSKHGVILHTVGIYSTNTGNDQAVEMRRFAYELAKAEQHVLELHGFFVDDEHKMCSFDLVVSFEAPDRREVVERVRSQIQQRYPDYTFVVALDSDVSD